MRVVHSSVSALGNLALLRKQEPICAFRQARNVRKASMGSCVRRSAMNPVDVPEFRSGLVEVMVMDHDVHIAVRLEAAVEILAGRNVMDFRDRRLVGIQKSFGR